MTKYNPEKHHRRSIRLKGYDYTQPGVYFVNICVQNRECLFGTIVGGEMRLNDAGRMLQATWEQMPQRFPTIKLDTYVVMPNHFHAIVIIVGAPLVGAQLGAGTRPAPTANPSLSGVIGAFKSITTNKYIHQVHNLNWPLFHKRLWQRNYYERIVRNERELDAIRQYIRDNPARWAEDMENPSHFTEN